MDETSVEFEIRKWLDKDASPHNAAEQLTRKILNPETSDEERLAYWKFLYLAGFYKDVIESMMGRLKNKSRVHWGILIETFSKCKIDPSNSIIESLFKGLKRQTAGLDLLGAESWDVWDARFSEIRNAVSAAIVQEAIQRRETMVEKFHFLKSQRMTEQAARVLKQLLTSYPDEESFKQLKESFDEEWAREILSARSSNRSIRDKSKNLSAGEPQLLKQWVEVADTLCDQNPIAAYDFAIGFYLLDAAEQALHFAERSVAGFGPDWLTAELFLQMRRYVDLLEHLHMLESKYVHDPETSFAVAYLRAQALHALGQSALAVEILRNIVQVRPNYRSANHMLLEWSVGAAAG